MSFAAGVRPNQLVLRPLSLNGVPFRFPWTQEFIRKVIRASTSAGPPIDPLYSFRCITFSNHYWKEPLGWPRAKPVGRAPETLNRQIQHLELAQIAGWMEPPKFDSEIFGAALLRFPEDLYGGPRER